MGISPRRCTKIGPLEQWKPLIRGCAKFRTSTHRCNLHYEVRRKPAAGAAVEAELVDLIRSELGAGRPVDGSGGGGGGGEGRGGGSSGEGGGGGGGGGGVGGGGGGACIVYCFSKNETESVAAALAGAGIPALVARCRLTLSNPD